MQHILVFKFIFYWWSTEKQVSTVFIIAHYNYLKDCFLSKTTDFIFLLEHIWITLCNCVIVSAGTHGAQEREYDTLDLRLHGSGCGIVSCFIWMLAIKLCRQHALNWALYPVVRLYSLIVHCIKWKMKSDLA